MAQKTEEKFVFPFERLEVWQLAVDLADFVLSRLESFPANRHFRLIEQMESAVCSIAQNIAEGSLFETLTLTEIMRRRALITDQDSMNIRKKAETIDRKLHGLINSLKKRG